MTRDSAITSRRQIELSSLESVRGPSDEDEDMVPCPHCESPHYVVSLADAIEEELLDVKESVVCVPVSKLVALTLRDVEAIGKPSSTEGVSARA